MNGSALFVAVFLACAVEAVEALTIVLAAGVGRDWRSALLGVGCSLTVLVLIVAGLGPALTAIPLEALRLVVGGLLLIFGLQWLRKSILRAAGLKAMHDEAAVYRTELAAAEAAPVDRRGMVTDWYSFTLSFKGVLLEGLEVAFIALTFGANQHNIPLAAIAALSAVVVVVLAGIAVRAPLARVPENSMKFIVGVMLTSFGIFWGAEGAGAQWPGADAALLALVPAVAVFALALVAVLRRTPGGLEVDQAGHYRSRAIVITRLRTFLQFWYDFIVGDDWRVALAVVAALALTYALSATGWPAWPVLPATVAVLLPLSLWRVARRQSTRRDDHSRVMQGVEL